MNEDANSSATRPVDDADDDTFVPTPLTADQLAWLRDRAATRESALGSQLLRFREQEGWTHNQLADHLGLTPEGLDQLSLAGRPRKDRFAADVRAIAADSGVPDLQLMQLLRTVESRAAFVGSPAARRIVAAARDHDDQTPSPAEQRLREAIEPEQTEDNLR